MSDNCMVCGKVKPASRKMLVSRGGNFVCSDCYHLFRNQEAICRRQRTELIAKIDTLFTELNVIFNEIDLNVAHDDLLERLAFDFQNNIDCLKSTYGLYSHEEDEADEE